MNLKRNNNSGMGVIPENFSLENMPTDKVIAAAFMENPS